MILSRNNKKLFISSLLIFMFIYEFIPIDMPSIFSSRKLSFLAVIVYLIFKNYLENHNNRFKFKIYCKLLMRTMLQGLCQSV